MELNLILNSSKNRFLILFSLSKISSPTAKTTKHHRLKESQNQNKIDKIFIGILNDIQITTKKNHMIFDNIFF